MRGDKRSDREFWLCSVAQYCCKKKPAWETILRQIGADRHYVRSVRNMMHWRDVEEDPLYFFMWRNDCILLAVLNELPTCRPWRSRGSLGKPSQCKTCASRYCTM